MKCTGTPKWLSVVFIASIACTGIDQATMTAHDQAPAPIRLPDSQRQRIATNFDPDAVEQIANLLGVDERRHFLQSFGGVPGEPVVSSPGARRDFSIMVRHSDPKIQALIEQMWAPYWEHEPAAALDDPNLKLPGKELAKKRRLERQQRHGAGGGAE